MWAALFWKTPYTNIYTGTCWKRISTLALKGPRAGKLMPEGIERDTLTLVPKLSASVVQRWIASSWTPKSIFPWRHNRDRFRAGHLCSRPGLHAEAKVCVREAKLTTNFSISGQDL